MQIRTFGQSLVLGCFLHFSAFGLTPTQVVAKAESHLRGETLQALLHLEVHRSSFERKMTVLTWSAFGKDSLVEILAPAKEAGVMSLRRARDMWNYLPKTDQVIRIPSSLMLQSWMGSDLTNDDLMKMSTLEEDYRHSKLRMDSFAGDKVQVIACTPNPGAPVVWGKILYWAREKDGLPVKEEFFDEEGQPVRTLVFSEFKKMDDRVIPTVITVSRAESPGEFTKLSYEKVLYNRKVNASLFERESLRRTSQKSIHLSENWFLDSLVHQP